MVDWNKHIIRLGKVPTFHNEAACFQTFGVIWRNSIVSPLWRRCMC